MRTIWTGSTLDSREFRQLLDSNELFIATHDNFRLINTVGLECTYGEKFKAVYMFTKCQGETTLSGFDIWIGDDFMFQLVIRANCGAVTFNPIDESLTYREYRDAIGLNLTSQ